MAKLNTGIIRINFMHTLTLEKSKRNLKSILKVRFSTKGNVFPKYLVTTVAIWTLVGRDGLIIGKLMTSGRNTSLVR